MPEAPTQPAAVEPDEDQMTVGVSPTRLAFRRFLRHKMGMAGLVVLCAFFFLAAFAHFVSPYHFANEARALQWAPPSELRFRDETGFHLRPYIHPFSMEFDENFNIIPKPDTSRKCYVRFFVQGDEYEFLGLFKTRLRLFGVDPVPNLKPGEEVYSRIYLLGADGAGRDIFSRICYGARISMTIGLIGSFFVLFIGMAVGGASGYFGGRIDNVLQRICEMVMLLPGFYLLLMLRFIFPPDMDSVRVYFAVILILSLVGWPAFARVLRGMVLAIRKEDYVQAARALGLGHARIVGKHLLPNTVGYIIVATTLRIPGYILGESALSLLGLGIMEPVPSWGNMLSKAMDIPELNQHPWVLWPGVFIFLAVLAFNLVGDGLRDCFDPRLHRS